MLEFVVEGHDGAAKTPVAEAVKDALESKWLTVSLAAPFYKVKDLLNGHDIYPMWANDDTAIEAVRLLQCSIQTLKDDARAAGCDVLLFDRHWMTVWTEIKDRPAVLAHWSESKLPTFVMETTPERTKQTKRFNPDMGWTSSDQIIRHYNATYLEIADAHPDIIMGRFSVTHREQDLTPIIDTVSEHILEALLKEQERT